MYHKMKNVNGIKKPLKATLRSVLSAAGHRLIY